MNNTKFVVVVSDLHINSTVALSRREVPLDDGGSYRASKAQLWLLDNWIGFWEHVKLLKSQLGAKVITVINGDLLDINKHSSHQLITKNQSSIINHALHLLDWVEADSMYIIRGTEAHTGPTAELEEIIAQALPKVKQNPETGLHSWWTLDLEVNGTRFDFAHHGKVGMRSWTRSNALNVLASEIMLDCVQSERDIPHLAFRSHMHLHADTYDRFKTRVIQTPAWQLSTAFSHRMGFITPSDIGGIIVRCENGVYDVEKVLFKPEQSTKMVE